jgi:hypothetical protein
MPTTTTTARPSDQPYLDHLQLSHRDQLGFLPRVAQLEFLTRGQALILLAFSEPAGFLLWRPTRHPHPLIPSRGLLVVQLCIDPGLRRILHASMLLAALHTQTAHLQPSFTRCWCASDLEANLFWSALHFQHDLTRDQRQAGRTQRTHHHWTLHHQPP